jgi:cbb3-type cytochrome oxidase maturation protein
MTILLYLIPAALALGALGLAAFLWSLKSGQYEDLDGAAERILFDDDAPLPDPKRRGQERDRPGQNTRLISDSSNWKGRTTRA